MLSSVLLRFRAENRQLLFSLNFPLHVSQKDTGTNADNLNARQSLSRAYRLSRISRLRTVLECHAPPRAVRMPRASSAPARSRSVVSPDACMSRTIGSTLEANWSAPARLAA